MAPPNEGKTFHQRALRSSVSCDGERGLRPPGWGLPQKTLALTLDDAPGLITVEAKRIMRSSVTPDAGAPTPIAKGYEDPNGEAGAGRSTR